MIEQITNFWKNYKPKQFARIFKEYAISKGLRQLNFRDIDYSSTYLISSTGRNWNRVGCYYLSENETFGNENLLITLRKRAGDYLIIERKGKRAFEVDYSGIKHHDECLLKEIIQEHAELFKLLGVEQEDKNE